MRKPMMAGNWKMNKNVAEAVALAKAIRVAVNNEDGVDRVVCPPFVDLPAVAEALAGSNIEVGAQNMHWAANGAYTGVVSAPMLAGLAQYVILGHSERRQYFAETDEGVNKKIKAALEAGLTPIVCCGESLEQNEAGETQSFVSGQVRGALAGLDAVQVESLVIAYEPIWAIGTGLTATPEQAQEAVAFVRALIEGVDGGAAELIRILYGGSVKTDNLADLLALPDVDGALVGGASLDPAAFAEMIEAAQRT
jgi:triosephosphate isomerase